MSGTKLTNLLPQADITGTDYIYVVRGALSRKVLMSVVFGRRAVKTPFDFGAVTYDPDNEVDSTAALQAFFDDAKDPDNARQYLYDWSGDWGVTTTVFATYWDGADSPYAERRFRMGTLHVLTTAAAGIDPVLDIIGNRESWEGRCGIRHGGTARGYTAYAARKYLNGVRIRCSSYSTFGDFMVDCPKRWGVLIDSAQNTPYTVNGVTFPNSNNIGATINMVAGRNAGSCPQQGDGESLAISGRVQGGATGAPPGTFVHGEIFDPTPGTYGNSLLQRTKLTVSSTANLRIFDLVRTRLELTPAIYGTIAVAAVAGPPATATITWTTGDPTNLDGAGHGLAVGDLYPVFQAGPNAQVRNVRITGFSGTSNRVIAVDTPLVAHAATADATYKQYGEPSWHLVTDVIDGTHVSVFPWVPDQNNSPLFNCSGGTLYLHGSDNADSQVATVEGFQSAMGIFSGGLYATKIGNLLCESCELGVQLGMTGDSVSQGCVISSGHMEANTSDVLRVAATPKGNLNFSSNYDLRKMMGLPARTSTFSQEGVRGANSILGVEFSGGDVSYPQAGRASDEGADFFSTYYGLSNNPISREHYLNTDASPTLTVGYDRDVARLFPNHHWARVIWSSSSGGAPGGTLTLNLADNIRAQGWTFGGAGAGNSYAIAAPAKPVVLYLQFLTASKKVAIVRVNAA